jgi:putative tricarboxylic transport membrane protein
MEENFRRSLAPSSGDLMIFVYRPISLTILIASLGLALLIVLPQFRSTREVVFQE